MPPLPPIANVCRLVPQFTYNGERCNYVLHYQGQDTLVQEDLTALATEWRSNWDVFFKPLAPTTLSLDYLTVIDLGPAPLAAQDVTGGGALVGTNASPSLPNHVTIAASLRTAARGRSFRGRTYVVGLCEAQVVGNTIDGGTATSLLSAFENARVMASGSDPDFWNQVVLSYYSAGAIRATPIATPVTTISMNPTIDSQRRRLPGRGR